MPLVISQDAVDLIVTEEDTGEAYYVRHYEHFEWPEGASGPTVGIGYDCGYSTPGEIVHDWKGIVDDAAMTVLVHASGLKDEAAHDWVRQHGSSITITWDEAMRQFSEREVPKWIATVTAHLQHCDELHPDSLGALVSLTFNRGASFDLPGARYGEMRAIKTHMALRQFDRIPAEFASMQRLWPHGGDLWRRRAHEGALFKRGLDEAAAVAKVIATGPPGLGAART